MRAFLSSVRVQVCTLAYSVWRTMPWSVASLILLPPLTKVWLFSMHDADNQQGLFALVRKHQAKKVMVHTLSTKLWNLKPFLTRLLRACTYYIILPLPYCFWEEMPDLLMMKTIRTQRSKSLRFLYFLIDSILWRRHQLWWLNLVLPYVCLYDVCQGITLLYSCILVASYPENFTLERQSFDIHIWN